MGISKQLLDFCTKLCMQYGSFKFSSWHTEIGMKSVTVKLPSRFGNAMSINSFLGQMCK